MKIIKPFLLGALISFSLTGCKSARKGNKPDDLVISSSSWNNSTITFSALQEKEEQKILVQVSIADYSKIEYGEFSGKRVKIILIKGGLPGCSNVGIEEEGTVVINKMDEDKLKVSFDAKVKCGEELKRISGAGIVALPERIILQMH